MTDQGLEGAAGFAEGQLLSPEAARPPGQAEPCSAEAAAAARRTPRPSQGRSGREGRKSKSRRGAELAWGL